MKIFLRVISFWSLCLIWTSILANPVSDQTWQQIKTLRGIATQPNMTAPSLYVFFDPNCPYCADLWRTQLEGKPFRDVASIWVPVTYLGETSLGKGAALLRSAKKEDLASNFANFNHDRRLGSIAGVAPSDAERLALGKAKAVWLKLGGATPMFVYRTGRGESQVFLGLPPVEQLTEIIKTVAPSRLSTFSEK